ncbi:MAG TPA: DUF1800 domain-containing protein [Candidatus Kapabacteria bacterium]|nr:DUF1800 domain-containing protein [Candidatus Kapabacteria bacterium]
MDRRIFLGSIAATALIVPIIPVEVAAKKSKLNDSAGNPFDTLNMKANRSLIQSTLDPWNPNGSEWNVTTIGHLFRRAGFGATLGKLQGTTPQLGDISYALPKTPGQIVDELLDDSLLQNSLGTNSDGTNPPPPAYSTDGSTPWLHSRPNLAGPTVQEMQLYSNAMLNIRGHWAKQMAAPATMLRERMVLFWMNHFVVEEQKVYYPQSMYNYINYFRRNAWGNFKQMVSDVTTTPAMLIYLDGQLNAGSSPNENYAREVQELFTMGVYDKNGNFNYTQDDVEAVAHSLTGWTVDTTAQEPGVLPAKYNIARHDSSFQKIYDGVPRQYNLTAANVSMDKDVIDQMFEQRGDQIAWNICSKLYQFFVYHQITTDAEKAIVQQLADTFKNNNWSIKAVLSQLLKSQHFFDSVNIGASIKSPYDHILPMVRQFDLTLDELSGSLLYYYTYSLGQNLFDPPNVKGWPGYHTWISTATLPTRNAISTLLAISKSIPALGTDGHGNNFPAITLDDTTLLSWAKQFSNYSTDFDSMLAEMATFLCAQPLGPMALAYVKSQLPPNTYEWGTLTDQEKITAIRSMANNIMLLAEYQLQ